MRTHRDVAIATVQAVGAPAVVVALWLLLVHVDFPTTPTAAVVAIAALIAAGIVAVILTMWWRVGGFRNDRALHRWVRNGPEPQSVSPAIRLRFLRRLERRSVAFGRLYLVLAGLWLLLAFVGALYHDSALVLNVVTAGCWLCLGIDSIAFGKRWGGRVDHLVEETTAQLQDAARL
ncbi:hypothetical protein [Curtobacterium sp. VKM Ac-2922]|uniref:hypothetical protein n=1 Tax=Curtobacterium sp. VKM Ac-2922 TaxID=2929475 RepID=UPI001FB50007|nr:hypothetical protein [Curtobacterium sp. VKM Ac-2922]MCJ1714905.1 hypothetical protein [Curtobacterium sp. VKM Ac-2922]